MKRCRIMYGNNIKSFLFINRICILFVVVMFMYFSGDLDLFYTKPSLYVLDRKYGDRKNKTPWNCNMTYGTNTF